MSERDGDLLLASRRIPAPSSISTPAREALDRLIGADGLPLNARYEMPAPDDLIGWSATRDAVDQHYAKALGRLPEDGDADVETIIDGRTTIHVAAPASAADGRGVLIDLHGGALVFGGGEACRVGARRMADRYGATCYAVDYRMPPEHPYPAALDDCVDAYRHVLDRHAATQIVLHGRSAGGNLAAAMLLRARAEGLPMPAGLVLLSPQVDLTESGDSFCTNRMVDAVLPLPLRSNNLLYADGADLADPHLSPLFGDLRGFPPTLLQSGTRDLFLSNAVRMHRALRHAGVVAELHVFEAMPHGGFTGSTPEDLELEAEIGRFLAACRV